MKYEYLHKDAKKCMFTSTLVGTLITGLIIGSVYYYCFENLKDFRTITTIITVVLSITMIANLLISPHFRYKRYKYMITDDKIDLVEGYIFIKRDIVPIERIHKITLERGPIDNIYGLSKVILITAGGIVVIRFLKLKEAEKIVENLKNIVNEMIV